MRQAKFVLVALLLLCAHGLAQSTPVIGGACKLGSADVQIGGKQTQFFLKCEAQPDSEEGSGVWTVKSRAAAPEALQAAQHHPKNVAPKQLHSAANICEQDVSARESAVCAVSETCLQQNPADASSYLQCEQTTKVWLKKACQDGAGFSFETQQCSGQAKRTHRYPVGGGLVCTFSSCSASNPCQQGNCNNGYCCHSGSVAPVPIVVQASAGLAPQIVTIPSYQPQGCAVGCPRGFSGCCGTQQASCCQRQMCPGGVAPTGRSCYTSCPSGQLCVAGVCCPQANTGVQLTCPGGSQPYGMCQNGYCAQGYQCVQSTGMCCAVVQQSYSCPGGSLSVGQCINGQCGNGYSCNSQSNLCCQASTRNPFVCPDGTQAAGACVNGQCGGNFKCSNGLCCAHTATTPRCLDGTEAVGACMNGRCGDGYACTVGNICCIANLVEACPAGHEALGPCVGGLCPAVSQCVGGQCCAATGGIPGAFMCVDPTDAIAPCDDDAGCPAGYKCDTSEGGPGSCCPNPVQDPTPDNELLECQAGQMENECPDNYACVGGQNGKCRLVNPCVVDSVGPCIGAAGCPQGNTCNNGFCCPAARVHRAPVLPPAFRVYRPSIGSCPGGAAAVGGCFNGACGSGFSCLSGVCCPSSALQYSPGRACPNGMPAVGGCFDGAVCGVGYVCDVISNMCCSVAAAQTNNYNRCADGSAPLGSCPTGMDTCPRGYRCRGTICCRASLLSSEVFVGGRCQRDQECAGSAARLTLCVAGICRCEPLGFSTAPFPCVRRSYHFRLNDSPIPEDSNATVSSATTAAPEASTATKSS